MMRYSKIHNITSKQGFTLAELLVVVAILGILVTVSLVVFGGNSEDAARAACDANKTAIKQYLDINAVNSMELVQKTNYTDAELEGLLTNAKASMDEDGNCPSGGTYTLSMSADGNFVVTCSVHDGGGLNNCGNNSEIVKKFLNDLKNSGLTVKAVDSTAVNSVGIFSKNVTFVRDLLTNTEIDPNSSLLNSWQYNNTGDKATFLCSDVKIADLQVGNRVPVLRYRYSSDTYTIWIVTVTNKETDVIVNDKTERLKYNTFGEASGDANEITNNIGASDKNEDTLKKDYNAIKKIYDDVMKLYNDPNFDFSNATGDIIRETLGLTTHD